MDKKGTIDPGKFASGVILLIIGIVVVFSIIAGTADTLTDSATNVSTSGLPLANLFASDGVILIAVMAGILLAIILGALAFAKLRRR